MAQQDPGTHPWEAFLTRVPAEAFAMMAQHHSAALARVELVHKLLNTDCRDEAAGYADGRAAVLWNLCKELETAVSELRDLAEALIRLDHAYGQVAAAQHAQPVSNEVGQAMTRADLAKSFASHNPR